VVHITHCMCVLGVVLIDLCYLWIDYSLTTHQTDNFMCVTSSVLHPNLLKCTTGSSSLQNNSGRDGNDYGAISPILPSK